MTPSKIGRYIIKTELMRGGMATVYHAYDPLFEREVAIKVLPRDMLIDPEFRTRFEREAKTLASLEHPAIVPVYDFGSEDGRLYLVMRYMPGGSLADRLKNGQLSPAEAARILTRLAPGLDEAHRKGIIHRDLKPANILFDQRGEPYISDFGVVKLSGVKTTSSGRITVGTPAYMSPEQARGEPNIDNRSDIFALGAVLFEMLTGHIPYEADTPAGQLVRRITDPVPNILEFNPSLPARTQDVIERALAKRPYVRFGSASELARAFRAVLKDDLTSPGGAKRDSASGSVTRRNGSKTDSLKKQTIPSKTGRRVNSGVLLALLAILLVAAGAVTFMLINPWTGNAGATNGRAALGQLTPTSTATSFPDFASVLEVSGVAQIKRPGEDVSLLRVGASVPVSEATRLWTTTGLVKLQLQDGSVLYMGENTLLTGFKEADYPASPPSVVMEQGRLLVKTSDLVVMTDNPAMQARIEYSVAGITYEPVLQRFWIDCLEGRCLLGEFPHQEITSGQRLGYDRGTLAPMQGASYDPWLIFGGTDVPTPTTTPTLEPTATDTPLPTLTPTPTETPTTTIYEPPPQPVQPQPVFVPTNTPRPPSNNNPPPASSTPSSNEG